MSAAESKKSQEVIEKFDTSALDLLDNPNDIAQYFADAGIDITDNKADGIKVIDILDDKDRLIKQPFVMVSWTFNKSDSVKDENGDPREFVSIEAVTKAGERFVINDGSTGIYRQLKTLTAHREETGHKAPQAGRFVSKGLRRSDYAYDEAGNTGTTYYLDF